MKTRRQLGTEGGPLFTVVLPIIFALTLVVSFLGGCEFIKTDTKVLKPVPTQEDLMTLPLNHSIDYISNNHRIMVTKVKGGWFYSNASGGGCFVAE